MRILTALALLALAGCAVAAEPWGERRDLSLDAGGLEALRADVGAGSLTLTGGAEGSRIEVEATLWIEDHPRDPEETRRTLEEYVEIRLERDGDRALLVTRTRDPGLGYSMPHVDLVVRAPSDLDLDIVDRSGYIVVRGFAREVSIRDDSGSIELEDIGGPVAIDDQSGSITLSRIRGPVVIHDESGSIDVEQVRDDVAIRDGSGSIMVRGVRGDVHIRDGSGSIDVTNVRGTLRIPEAGSGTLHYADIEGGVELED